MNTVLAGFVSISNDNIEKNKAVNCEFQAELYEQGIIQDRPQCQNQNKELFKEMQCLKKRGNRSRPIYESRLFTEIRAF